MGTVQPGLNDVPSENWANRIWHRFGLPGLALASPAIIGVHLATVIALALQSKKRTIELWMTVSVFVWTVVLTVWAHYGIELLQVIGGWCEIPWASRSRNKPVGLNPTHLFGPHTDRRWEHPPHGSETSTGFVAILFGREARSVHHS